MVLDAFSCDLRFMVRYLMPFSEPERREVMEVFRIGALGLPKHPEPDEVEHG
jgi:hypothetical protein